MAARDLVLDALIAAIDVPLPEGVVANALADHFGDGHGDDDHRAEFETQVRESLTRDLVLDTLADRDSVEVTQAEITEYLIRQSSQYGMTPDQFAQAVAQAGQVGAIIGDVRRSKALSVVLEAATIRDTAGEIVELSASSDDAEEVDVDAGQAELAEADDTDEADDTKS
jgi:trigger factor